MTDFNLPDAGSTPLLNRARGHVVQLVSSKRAVAVKIGIMRVFVRRLQMLVSNATLARKLAALKNTYDTPQSLRAGCYAGAPYCI